MPSLRTRATRHTLAVSRTCDFQHFVAFIQDKVLEVIQLEFLSADDQVLNTPRCANNNVRLGFFDFFNVRSDWCSAEEAGGFDAGQVLGEALEFFLDLDGQFAGVAHNHDVDFAINRLELLECGEDKHGCLTHATLGLADDIRLLNCLRDAAFLHCNER